MRGQNDEQDGGQNQKNAETDSGRERFVKYEYAHADGRNRFQCADDGGKRGADALDGFDQAHVGKCPCYQREQKQPENDRTLLNRLKCPLSQGKKQREEGTEQQQEKGRFQAG